MAIFYLQRTYPATGAHARRRPPRVISGRFRSWVAIKLDDLFAVAYAIGTAIGSAFRKAGAWLADLRITGFLDDWWNWRANAEAEIERLNDLIFDHRQAIENMAAVLVLFAARSDDELLQTAVADLAGNMRRLGFGLESTSVGRSLSDATGPVRS